MHLMEWTPSLSVNVGSIDHEHQAIVGMINELHEAMLHQQSRDVLGKIIARLTSYTVGHFGHEEKIMRATNFHGYAQHKAEHDAFIQKVSEFRHSFEEGKLMLSSEIMHFLKNWLKNHIQGTDKQYSMTFNEAGYH